MIHSVYEQDMQLITNAKLPWSNFKDQTILITGANGFLPAYMIETLLYLNRTKDMGCKIIGMVRNRERAANRFKYYIDQEDLKLIIQDVANPCTINEKIDYIVHAASQASPKFYGVDPVGTLSANVLGTYNLLELSRKNKIKNFLYFSSGEVYGEVTENQIPTAEHDYGYIDPLNVRSCYAESKKMAENMIISYAHQYQISTTIARPFHIYGPGLRLDDGRVYSDFLSDIINDRDIVIKGDGLAVRAFCYLADATIAFFTVLLKGENSEAYNVGNPGCSLSINELASQLIELYPEKNLKIIKKIRKKKDAYLSSPISVNCPDISKITALGWNPSTSIQAGFKKTVENFMNLLLS